MALSLSLFIAGAIAYICIKGDYEDEIVYNVDDSLYYDSDEDYEQLTFDYFMSLNIDEQEAYFRENLDLKYYKDDTSKGLTTDRYLNAKHAMEIARITGKKFTDKYKTY